MNHMSKVSGVVMKKIDALEEAGGTEARCRNGYKMEIFTARFCSNNRIVKLARPACIANRTRPARIADHSTNIHRTAD